MKKLFPFLLLMGSLAVMNAQSVLGVTHQGHTYNEGDTITLTLAADDEEISSLGIINQGNNRIENIIIALQEISRNGFEVWAMCTGDVCIPGLTSNPINMAPRATYNDLTLDVRIDATVSDPLSIYTMTVGNDEIHTTVVLRLVLYQPLGIHQPEAVATVNAYPNPAIGEVDIHYSVPQAAMLTVFDMQGRKILSQPVNGTGKVSLDTLPAGVYTYGLTTGDAHTALHKLIVR